MSESVFLKKWMNLPEHLQKEVVDFMDFLASKKKRQEKEIGPEPEQSKRQLGLGKGMITIMDNFDDPIEGFDDYI